MVWDDGLKENGEFPAGVKGAEAGCGVGFAKGLDVKDVPCSGVVEVVWGLAKLKASAFWG